MALALAGSLAGVQCVFRWLCLPADEGFPQCAPAGARGSPTAREVSWAWAWRRTLGGSGKE